MSYTQLQHGGSDWGAGDVGYDGHVDISNSSECSPQSPPTFSSRRSLFHHRHLEVAPLPAARTSDRYNDESIAIGNKCHGGSEWGTGDIGYDGHVPITSTIVPSPPAMNRPRSAQQGHYWQHSLARPSTRATTTRTPMVTLPPAATVAIQYARTMHDGSEWGTDDVGYDGHSSSIPAS